MKRGFTLIETFVAIVILMLAVATQITISQRGISSATSAREQLIAQYLAQDGLEIVRMLRDGNVLSIAAGNPINWLENIWDTCGEGASTYSKCYVDRDSDSNGALQAVNDLELVACGAICPSLKYHKTTGVYDIGTTDPDWVPTTFVRTIWITPSGPTEGGIPTEQAIVKSRITWRSGSQNREIVLTDLLFNRGI